VRNPLRPSTGPDPDSVRAELHKILAEARAAQELPVGSHGAFSLFIAPSSRR